MYDLEKLKGQMRVYHEQRTNHLTMFNQFSGAISVLEELIKEMEKECSDVKTDDQSPEETPEG